MYELPVMRPTRPSQVHDWVTSFKQFLSFFLSQTDSRFWWEQITSPFALKATLPESLHQIIKNLKLRIIYCRFISHGRLAYSTFVLSGGAGYRKRGIHMTSNGSTGDQIGIMLALKTMKYSY
jgi:hypothetical protein